jgi:S-adenosylmethionine:tRNA ribosyltransferase-isomerase
VAAPPATEPPEARGLERDEVRLLVADGRRVRHTVFRQLAGELEAGDLVVVNTSATLPAALDGLRRRGEPVTVHVSGPLPGGSDQDPDRVLELRSPAGGRVRDGHRGESVALPDGVTATLLAAYPDRRVRSGSRLWHARLPVEGGIPRYLARVGRPISYGYLPGRWPLAAYQTVFAREPGSAEMPSAGRPFTSCLVTDLVARGVAIAPITLHTGVSSLEAGERPLPERYRVPDPTARLVNVTRRAGGRIVAVGTTVARALETVAAEHGHVRAGAGWTDLVLGPDRPARVVNGLVTGWHDPDSSHLLLLEALAEPDVVADAYAAARAEGYRWHEFGDSCLLLPRGPVPRRMTPRPAHREHRAP